MGLFDYFVTDLMLASALLLGPAGGAMGDAEQPAAGREHWIRSLTTTNFQG
jgi:hypothetical protein